MASSRESWIESLTRSATLESLKLVGALLKRAFSSSSSRTYCKLRRSCRSDIAVVTGGVRGAARHEVCPRLFEECIEPIFPRNVDLGPILHGSAQPGLIHRRRVRVFVQFDAGRIKRPRHGKVREVPHSRLVFDLHVALLNRPEHALKCLHGRLALAHLDVRNSAEKLRLNVVLAAPIDLVEERERFWKLAVPGFIPA